jgi:hypothetical protein
MVISMPMFASSNGMFTSLDQIDADINGEVERDFSGSAVSLSSDSEIDVIGSWKHDSNYALNGHIRVFKWNTSTSAWDQMRADIAGIMEIVMIVTMFESFHGTPPHLRGIKMGII